MDLTKLWHKGKTMPVDAIDTLEPVFAPIVPSCSHTQQPVTIGDKVIYASKINYDKTTRFTPDLGIYFTSSWQHQTGLVLTNGVPAPEFTCNYPSAHLLWEDGKAFDIAAFTWAITLAQASLTSDMRVEVGCFGGHGRTGTFLACLLGKAEGLKAAPAIKRLRERYCKEAVETYDQIDMVGSFLGGSVKEISPSHIPVYETITYLDGYQKYIDGGKVINGKETDSSNNYYRYPERWQHLD